MAMKELGTRVPEDVREQFDARAAELGKSRGEHLRDLVTDYVITEGTSPESEELAEVRRELRAIRNTLLTSVAGLLNTIGNFPPDKAEAWVREHLLE